MASPSPITTSTPSYSLSPEPVSPDHQGEVSPTQRKPSSPVSPTQRSLLAPIANKLQPRPRSRSRSRTAPCPLTPASIDPSHAQTAQSQTNSNGRPCLPHGKTTPTSVSFSANRPGELNLSPTRTPANSRTVSFTRYGRHTNQWLFNNFSLTETMRGILGTRRNSS